MKNYIIRAAIIFLSFLISLGVRSQDCITFHSDFTGMEWDEEELTDITTAACELRTLLDNAGVAGFEVHTLGLYAYNPYMQGGTEAVWNQFLADNIDTSAPHLAIGKKIGIDGEFKRFWISFSMPATDCFSPSASDKIQTKLRKYTPSASSNPSPVLIISDCIAEIKILTCLCDGQDPSICLKDWDRRLTRELGFRKTQIKIGLDRQWPEGQNGIYDYFGKEVIIDGSPYYIPEEVNDSKTQLASNTTYEIGDTTIMSSGINGYVYILTEDDIDVRWENMQNAAANVDYVECWVVLKDQYGKYWLYSRFSFGPFDGNSDFAVRGENHVNNRGVTLSPWGLALKVLGNSAIDAVVQAVIIRLTDVQANDWESAFKKVDYLGAAWSGLSSLLPWKSNKNKLEKAIIDGFIAVAAKATEPSYTVSQALKDFVVMASASLVTSFASQIKDKVSQFLEGAFRMIASTSGGQKVFAKAVATKCFVLGGCFVQGTPVISASDTGLHHKGIEQIRVLDNVAAHTTVNATYGLIASTDEIFGTKAKLKDPYTSDEQRERDTYQLNDTDWCSVRFHQVGGMSDCQLALHRDWIEKKGYHLHDTIHMNLLEQGITGPFHITDIKHILPQKVPDDDDLADGYAYRPVTGIFTHVSDKVLMIYFASGDSLGITENHPVYSATAGQWKHAFELEQGETVLSYLGQSKVTKISKLQGTHQVYNLEVKDLHNFLVGNDGVVVHNGCENAIENYVRRVSGNPNWRMRKPRGLTLGTKTGCPKCVAYTTFNGKKIYFDNDGFPLFEEFAPRGSLNNKIIKFEDNHLAGYTTDTPSGKDLSLATNWFKQVKSQYGNNITFNGHQVIIGGVSYTWHHHQDGLTMFLVPTLIHNSIRHTGGGAMIKYGLKGAFSGPIF